MFRQPHLPALHLNNAFADPKHHAGRRLESYHLKFDAGSRRHPPKQGSAIPLGDQKRAPRDGHRIIVALRPELHPVDVHVYRLQYPQHIICPVEFELETEYIYERFTDRINVRHVAGLIGGLLTAPTTRCRPGTGARCPPEYVVAGTFSPPKPIHGTHAALELTTLSGAAYTLILALRFHDASPSDMSARNSSSRRWVR